jgi:hypothetical protein
VNSYNTETTDDASRTNVVNGVMGTNTIGVNAIDLSGNLGGTFGFFNDSTGIT